MGSVRQQTLETGLQSKVPGSADEWNRDGYGSKVRWPIFESAIAPMHSVRQRNPETVLQPHVPGSADVRSRGGGGNRVRWLTVPNTMERIRNGNRDPSKAVAKPETARHTPSVSLVEANTSQELADMYPQMLGE
jgi:hypothetical protein